MLPGSLPQFLEDMQEDWFLSNITAMRKSNYEVTSFPGWEVGKKQKSGVGKHIKSGILSASYNESHCFSIYISVPISESIWLFGLFTIP